MAQPLSSAIQMPAAGLNHDQAASTPLASVSHHFIAQYYETGEYSDLDIVSNGVVRSVHKIIVCSESPVIKHKCSLLGHEQRLNLDQYDAETLGRVLDFCYRRTYSDGEYPEIVAPFLLSMTASDVRNALQVPLAVASDVADPEWRADCTQCETSEGPQNEGADDQDEYLPDRCEIRSPSDDDFEPLNDEDSLVSEPAERQGPVKPPYTISLFTNFDVYIAAKELQIPALQLLARQRFSQTLRSYWARITHLPALIEHVYLRTDDGDALRALVCQIVAARYDSKYSMDFKAKIREVMVRNGEFAADVLDTTLGLRCEWADMK